MANVDKKSISEALREAMNKEELHTRQAARFLNLNPAYISMSLNPNSWNAMSKMAWFRLEDWFNRREPLSSFSIPEGEEIWKPKEKAANTSEKEPKKPAMVKPELTASEKAYLEDKAAHDRAVIARNEMDKMFPGIKTKYDALAAPEPVHIPITLDLKINIEVQLCGKTINTSRL
jgi:hypothetical protein